MLLDVRLERRERLGPALVPGVPVGERRVGSERVGRGRDGGLHLALGCRCVLRGDREAREREVAARRVEARERLRLVARLVGAAAHEPRRHGVEVDERVARLDAARIEGHRPLELRQHAPGEERLPQLRGAAGLLGQGRAVPQVVVGDRLIERHGAFELRRRRVGVIVEHREPSEIVVRARVAIVALDGRGKLRLRAGPVAGIEQRLAATGLGGERHGREAINSRDSGRRWCAGIGRLLRI